MLKLCLIFDCLLLLLLLCTNQTAITRRLRTRNPTAIPIATAPPVFTPCRLGDVEFAFMPSVDLAVGFSVGIEGGVGLIGLPVVDELLRGAGGELVGTVGNEGTGGGEGGEDAGAKGEADGASEVGAGGGGDKFTDDFGGGEGLEEGGVGTFDGGGGEGETARVGGGGED